MNEKGNVNRKVAHFVAPKLPQAAGTNFKFWFPQRPTRKQCCTFRLAALRGMLWLCCGYLVGLRPSTNKFLYALVKGTLPNVLKSLIFQNIREGC